MKTKFSLPLLGSALLLASCGGGTPQPTVDRTAPTVSLSGAQSGSSVNLTASASDNVGVTKVEFYRGATLIATDTTAPFTASFAVTSSDNGQLNVSARAYDAAGNQGQAGAQVTVNVARTSTLYQGVWGWAVADANTEQIIQRGAMILFDEVQNEGRRVAVGGYTNEAQTQTGASLLGPITAAGELETFFSYDLNAESVRAYLVASDDDGRLENYQGSPTFFGAGALVDRVTQQPNRAVYVALVQVSSEVPEELTAQAAAKADARALAAQAVQRQFRTGAALQAQALKVSGIQQEAVNLLERR
ncbi:Ig-like domain-containing protein [Deinococcus sp. MIMF12]|uniref:Ig-like domain-containing protein n=1 Tax=Deinococcus rhizophilus TaxID=3049544 RepID=A0ABT7JGE6_9DEIO|nr:Ig-like domain-containing protein [Deinococcus rhizophilus]MDL2344129.1 Ig-like domain-containing protein [Deinococcus rhizophilus]